MSAALINLVKLNAMDDTIDNDYTTGETLDRHEEIELVDPNGCPCAIPAPSAFENLDYRHNFITGGIGSQGRIIKRKLSISIDWIDSYVARRLEKWMHQRAHVLVCPNFGRNTEFSFRPIDLDGSLYATGSTAYDLTGNHQIEHSQSTGTLLLWDEILRQFIKKPVSDITQYFETPGGAGFGSPRSVRNLMKPPYPESATEGTGAGKSGWVKGGTDSSQITFTYVPIGFGHTDCVSSLKVEYTSAVTSSRYLEIDGLFDPASGDYGGISLSGSGDMVFCMWIRGQLPDSAELIMNNGIVDIQVRDLSGERFNGWTPLMISLYASSWSSVVAGIKLDLSSSLGVAGSFEIGPAMICQASGNWFNAGPYWTDSDSYSGKNTIQTSWDFDFPRQGTGIASFTLPEWWGADYTSNNAHRIFGSSSTMVFVGLNYNGEHFIQIRDITTGGNFVVYLTGNDRFNAGEINTVALTWNGAEQVIYANGVNVGSVNMTAQSIDFASSITPLRVGDGWGDNCTYPALILSVRIEEGAMTAEDVGNIHYALTDPIALQFAMNQRGRIYQITGIPQTVRISDNGSQILGNLTLEQVGFNYWLADPMNKEETVR